MAKLQLLKRLIVRGKEFENSWNFSKKIYLFSVGHAMRQSGSVFRLKSLKEGLLLVMTTRKVRPPSVQ